MELNSLLLDEIIRRCLVEDIGTGDITTNSLVPAGAVTTGLIQAKGSGVIAGMAVAERVFKNLDPEIVFEHKVSDGTKVEPRTVLAEVKGSARAVLTGERLALNFLQRLSGIATKTAELVELISMYPVKIVDTRKTTPGIRMLEKYAVRVGGGYNHRFGLYDAVLIKDNHIKIAGGITRAVNTARRQNPHTVKIEVEVQDLEGVQEALSVNVDIIMLDNMEPSLMREAVEMVNGRALVEASGGITKENIVPVAKSGVDLISIGALTHSVTALDISLDVEEIK
ncbi:nicotinate-nucleotide pyrophosphorylase (carboxylating) [Desulfohalotomaculum tongense]|uniref:carboxylating nicotinate-nucleotide diphosphorylase n=1 Tax=Desulforadius tongensis TaxID=1216062 RepID=UPI00195C3FF0|nr:carboxylating nicotinate-nucleotide diphosphorylase [Desulforadius tongensis]MBM7856038.1 nicotinate-nucleotide pyrophosphorylase (carboxylating) [Desulforadius tongensis]